MSVRAVHTATTLATMMRNLSFLARSPGDKLAVSRAKSHSALEE